MVCRDSKTHRATPVNPLQIDTPEDEKLFRIGEGTSSPAARIMTTQSSF